MSDITLKTPAEIERMRAAGRIVGEVLDGLNELIQPGVPLGELDQYAEETIRGYGAIPSFKGYPSVRNPDSPFPGSICASVNDVIVHGIPNGYVLREGDILGVDCGAILDGWHGDSARTYRVGRCGSEASDLLRTTEEALGRGIAALEAGKPLGRVGHAIQQHAEAHGFAVVREFVGHGVGRSLHEAPRVANFGSPDTGPIVEVGLTIAIEPMVNVGTIHTKTDPDGWTIRTADGSLSAHYEHTVAVTETGPEILTLA